MKKIRKLLLCMMIALAAVFIAPHGMTSVEVQAAAVETPRLGLATSGKYGTFSWNRVKGASGYKVYRKVDGKRWRVMKIITNGSIDFYEDYNMKPGVCYVYTVRAYKKENGKTLWSSYDKEGVRVIAHMSMPKVTVQMSTTKECTVNITVDPVEGAQGYCIYRRRYDIIDDWKKIGQTTKTTYEDSSAEPGYTYLYTARAYSKCHGEVRYSDSNRRGVRCKVMKTNPYYAKVRDYVLKKGYTDKNGMKYIRKVMTVDDVKFQWRIYYNKKEDRLELIQLSEGKDYRDKMLLVLNETPLEVKPSYSFYMGNAHLYGDTAFEASSYRGKRDEWFSLRAYIDNEQVEIEEYEEENKAVNVIMRLAFAGWNELLNSRMKVSLKNLGFKSYIPIA